MIINERENRRERVLQVAEAMLTAARTAPKARGVDILECCIVEGDDINRLSDAMMQLFEETGRPVFERDAANILQADAIVIVATRPQTMGLNCGHCGFTTCAQKPNAVPCVFNSVDIGIALGSAAAKAADCRVDTRIMYSAGMGAQRLGLLNEPDNKCRQYFAIPVSAYSKSPFFDRKA